MDQAGQAAEAPGGTYARDHILIRFKPEARALLPTASLPGQLTELLRRLNLPEGTELQEAPLVRLLRQKGKSISPPAPDQVELHSFFYLRLPPGLEVADCVRRLENHPLLEYAEPDGIGTGSLTIPTDPNFADQWHHQNPSKPSAAIATPLAWDITRGSTNVLVAVLDTGLADLPEFAGRIVPGYNFAYTNEVTLDDKGHGTQVAGIDQVRNTNGQVELSWISPANASNKQPYRVEYRSSVGGDWIPLTDTNAFRYGTNRTYWTDDGTQSGGLGDLRFYRVGLRPF